MGTPINILIVEDSQDDAALLVDELRTAGFDPVWKRVDTEAAFLEEVKGLPDIIFSDYTMPRFNGLSAALLLRGTGSEIPFILVSGTLGEERVAEGFKAGATDFVVKDRLERLGHVVKRALGEVRERTERKQMERQFIESQKMEVVGLLASGVAHDFNNILGVIMGYGELITEKLSASDPVKEYAGEILEATKRAAALTQQLLLFSSKHGVQPAVIELNHVIKETHKMLSRLVDANIELTIPAAGSEVGFISADAGYIGQVLLNLVVNARDAMPNGGKLAIETGILRADETFAAPYPGMAPGEYVTLTVTDTGLGMTEEVKSRLFEAFFTTKPKGKGTGLGLATCQTIVKQCNGYLGVESAPGQGAKFRIYFPRVKQPVPAIPHDPKPASLLRGTETVMIVEDEPAVRHLTSTILEWQGYTVLTAHNGEEGLRVARDTKGAPISLVITDVIMPLMGGKVMAEWLRTTYPDIKILFTSGYAGDGLVLESGMAFLPKPYTPAALTRKVREILDKPAALAAR